MKGTAGSRMAALPLLAATFDRNGGYCICFRDGFNYAAEILPDGAPNLGMPYVLACIEAKDEIGKPGVPAFCFPIQVSAAKLIFHDALLRDLDPVGPWAALLTNLPPGEPVPVEPRPRGSTFRIDPRGQGGDLDEPEEILFEIKIGPGEPTENDFVFDEGAATRSVVLPMGAFRATALMVKDYILVSEIAGQTAYRTSAEVAAQVGERLGELVRGLLPASPLLVPGRGRGPGGGMSA